MRVQARRTERRPCEFKQCHGDAAHDDWFQRDDGAVCGADPMKTPRITVAVLAMLVLIAARGIAQSPRRVASDLILATPTSVDAGPEGTLVVADFAQPAIHFVARDGKVRWSKTSKGVGPGDVLRPYRAVHGDTTLLVYDFSARDFSRFTRDGMFLKRFHVSVAMTNIDDIVAIGDSLVVVLGTTRQTGHENAAIHVFSSDGRHLRSFGELAAANDRSKLSISGTGTLAKTPRNTLLYTRKGPFQLLEYTAGGKLVKSIPPPVSILAVADSVVRVESNSEGRERLVSRSQVIRFPLRAIPMSFGYTLAGVSDRGVIRWWIHSPSGHWRIFPLPRDLSPSSWNSVTCELVALRTGDDDEPALIMIDLLAVFQPTQSTRARCKR